MMYVRALGLFVRNPSIIVVPLLMAIVGVLVSQVSGAAGGGGGVLGGVASGVGSLTNGLMSFLLVLLNMFGFGAACIIADMAWRRGRASFDEGWNEARRKGGEILTAAMGFTFVLYLALFAGTLIGNISLILAAIAIYFLIYTIPAASIGGVPGGAALNVSIERARANPLPTIVVAIVSVALYLFLGVLLAPFIDILLAPLAFASSSLLRALLGALVQAIALSYIALIVTKTYSDISFGRR